MKKYLIWILLSSTYLNLWNTLKKMPSYISKYSGRYLVEGVTPEILDGNWQPKNIVVLEFETQVHANRFLSDPEVMQLFTIRHKNTKSNLVKISGGAWRDKLSSNT